jgi:serine phosphatase RsbU (regulator of sigma subunit)
VTSVTADLTTFSLHTSELTILLVEDDDGDALLVQAALEEIGIPAPAVTWARTLSDAVTAVADQPGCILLDLGLPDAAGYGAIDKMVAEAPLVPVIVLTGRQERDGLDALAAGAQDYLVKDAIDAEKLARSIRYAIERKRAQATQEQLREISLGAAEQARLERGLLPIPLLRSDAVSCSTYYRPGRDDAVLGGDFYDVVETPDGRIRAVVGDVMGHGPDEAALGVHLRVAWRSLLLAGVPDERILPSLALLLNAESDQPARFVTVCDIALDGTTMTVRLAGHPAPIVSDGDRGAAYLSLQVGVPLGLPTAAVAADWPENRVPVTPGMSVLMYTDGLLDAYFGESADGIGVDELVAGVAECVTAHQAPAAWVPTLLSRAPRDSIDDTAAVVLTVAPSA